MINYGIYYNDTLDHEQQVLTTTSIVEAMEEFNRQITSRDVYDLSVELCFVNENGIYIDTIYEEEYKSWRKELIKMCPDLSESALKVLKNGATSLASAYHLGALRNRYNKLKGIDDD